MRRTKPLPLMLAVAVALLCAASASPVRAATKAENNSTAENLTAIHDPESPEYDQRCLSCHRSVLTESSADPRIPTFHQAMILYVPGFNARKGVQDRDCITCHRNAVDFHQESGASLRKSVAIESCVYCHGPAGPGPVYYK